MHMRRHTSQNCILMGLKGVPGLQLDCSCATRHKTRHDRDTTQQSDKKRWHREISDVSLDSESRRCRTKYECGWHKRTKQADADIQGMGKTKDFIRITWQRNSQLRHSVHPLMVRRLGAAGGGTLPVSITWSYQIADSFDRL